MAGSGAPATTLAYERPPRPERPRQPADVSALPERIPNGAAATAVATADTRKGELRGMRTARQPAALLLREHRESVATTAVEAEQERTRAESKAPNRAEQQAPSQPSDDSANARVDSGGLGQVSFVELDPGPLLPPLWGQSPEQHDAEVQDCRQSLARDRAVGKEKLTAFTASRQAKSAELASLGQQMIRQVDSTQAAALTQIGSGETAAVAAVRLAVSGARSQVRERARTARDQVAAGYALVVAAMTAAAGNARTGMDNDLRTSDRAVTSLQSEQSTALGDLYSRTEQRMRGAANHAAGQAMAEANQRADAYLAGMIGREDNLLDGRLTDNRCKAQADAAIAVGQAYKTELPKAADEPIADMLGGRPDAEKCIRTIAADVRKSLNIVLAQSKSTLADAHNQSLKGASDAKAAALRDIDQALSVAELSLTQLQDSQTTAIRNRAAQQRQAVQGTAASAAAAIGKGVAAARSGVDRGVRELLRILSQDEVPDPEQLDEVLRLTGAQFDARLDETAEGLRRQTEQAGVALGALAQNAAQRLAAAAEAAAESAAQFTATTGQTLTRAAEQTLDGLHQVQQGHAELVRTMQTGHAQANQQVLQGLGRAYAELAGNFQKGADAQVKTVADALEAAATQDIHPKIDEEARKAYDQVKPRWQALLTILIVIVVVVALSIVLGPLVIGAVTAGAAALGAGAAAATIGVIVGGAVVGAVAGAVGQLLSNALNSQPLLDGVLKAAAFGAIGGAIGGGASAAVARTALGAAARATVEMGIEVVTEVGLGAADAGLSGQAFTWEDALLGVVTTVAVTGLVAHPRVAAMTNRIQIRIEASLNKIGINVPSPGNAADIPSTPEAGRLDVPSVAAQQILPAEVTGPTPGGGGAGGSSGGPRPGRGPDGATSWGVSDIDPTGGAGSVDGPVRPHNPDGMATELRRALGALAAQVDVRVDPSLTGRTVRVHYDLTEDLLITNVRMVVGTSATPTDIRLHAPTARTMLRYSGFSGRVRQVLRQITEWIGVYGPPPVGSRAWEAHLELKKLPAIIADRARVYANADPATRAELEAELDTLMRQVELHADTLREWNLDPGRGYVAADSAGQVEARRLGYSDDELPVGHAWRKYPDRPLELVQIDPSVKKHWFVVPSEEYPRGRIVGEKPETAPKPKSRFDANATPPTTKEQAFDMLGGNDPESALGKFISVLKDEGIIRTEAEFVAKMPEPAGRLYDDVRHTAKADFVRRLVDKVTTHADLLRVSGQLHSSDRGSLGEAWYAKTHAPGADSQIRVPKDAIDGVVLEQDRRLDLVEGDRIIEIKNIVDSDERRIRPQLTDLLKMVGNKISINGENRTINLLRVSFLDPEGVINNSFWLSKFLKQNVAANIEIEIFNGSGESRKISPPQWQALDAGSEQGKALVEWLRGATTKKGGR